MSERVMQGRVMEEVLFFKLNSVVGKPLFHWQGKASPPFLYGCTYTSTASPHFLYG